MNDRLSVDSQLLNNICQQYDSAQATFNRLNTTFETIVSESQHQVLSDKAECQQLLASLRHSVIDTIETNVKTEQVLINTKEFIESSANYLNERQLKKEAHELRTRALREAILTEEHTSVSSLSRHMH